MTISDTFETDQTAQHAFTGVIPKTWLVRKQDPDVHIDYDIEIVEDKHPTGQHFYVQLKGTRKAKIVKGAVKFKFETKPLKYYLDRVKIPVFLFHVDITSGCIYVLFLQKYLKEVSSKKSWRKSNSLTLSFPESNIISGPQALLELVNEAAVFMRKLWPSPMNESAAAEKSRLEELDNRINVDIAYKGNQTHILLNPKEPLNLSFKATLNDNTASKIKDMIDKGIPVSFDAGQLRITGSNLVENILRETGAFPISISFTRSHQVKYCIQLLNQDRALIETIYGIDGMVTGGRREVKFTGSFPKAPFQFEVEVVLDADGPNFKSKMDFTCPLDKWNRLPLLTLPYFEKIASLFSHLRKGLPAELDVETDGNSLFKVGLTNPNFSEINGFDRLLTLLSKARKIAKELKLNPDVGIVYEISTQDAGDIEILYSIIFNGECRVKAPEAKINMSLKIEQPFLDALRKDPVTSPITITSNNIYRFFGLNVNLGPIEQTFSGMQLVNDIKELVPGKDVDISMKGTPSTEILIKKIPLTP